MEGCGSAEGAASGTRGLRRTAMELRHENYLYKND
jgi:hypothetical protein